MEIAEGGGLDRAAEVDAQFFDGVGEVRDENFTDFVGAGLVEDEAEGAVGIVLADEDDGAVKDGAMQLAAIQKEFSFERLEFFSRFFSHMGWGECALRLIERQW